MVMQLLEDIKMIIIFLVICLVLVLKMLYWNILQIKSEEPDWNQYEQIAYFCLIILLIIVMVICELI